MSGCGVDQKNISGRKYVDSCYKIWFKVTLISVFHIHSKQKGVRLDTSLSGNAWYPVLSLHWNWLDCKYFSQPECQRRVQQQPVFSQTTVGLWIQCPWKTKLADESIQKVLFHYKTSDKGSFFYLLPCNTHLTKTSRSLILFLKTKMNPSSFGFFAGMLHGNISSLLQGCNCSLSVSLYKRNRVCSASKNYLALLLTGFSSSPTNKPPWHKRALGTASLATTDHPSQFPMLKITQKQTEEWDSKNCCHGGEVHWWKKTKQRTMGPVEGQADEYQNWGGVGLHHQTQRKNKAGQYLFSIQLRCAWPGWLKTNLQR